MPGLPECSHCPFRDDLETPCAVFSTGHRRFCEAIDPDGPTHRPRMRAALVRLTLELLGRPLPPEPTGRAATEARRAGKRRVPLGTKVEAKPGGD